MEDIYYKTINQITSILLFVEEIKDAAYGEMVDIRLENGDVVPGQVLDSRSGLSIIQSFSDTRSMNLGTTRVRFSGSPAKLRVSTDMLGRIFDGMGNPRDGGPKIHGGQELPISGSAINPYSREEPSEFIETGISAIDCMNTLVRGQKLPIFSGAGLPHNQLAAQIARQAKLPGSSEDFAVVFGGMGINSEEANFFKRELESTGAMERAVMFLNLSSEPSMERITLPRMALTAAEHLAYNENMHVLVILTDMTNYCESLKEVSAAREEVPGRRGFPGYMYTDLSTVYERAGRIKGRKGSITQIPILTMPGDDITHPIPDLTGYITEGQIVLGRDIHRKGIYPDISVLPSLSRLMNRGIGKNSTREDHRGVADQLYAAYAHGRDVGNLMEIVGDEALTKNDKQYLKFSNEFESRFVNQAYYEDRGIEDTLNLGWELLSMLDKDEMRRLSPEQIEKYGRWKGAKE